MRKNNKRKVLFRLIKSGTTSEGYFHRWANHSYIAHERLFKEVRGIVEDINGIVHLVHPEQIKFIV